MVCVGAGACVPVETRLRTGAEAAGVESVDDVVAVAFGCAGEVEAAVEAAASGWVVGGLQAGRGDVEARAADAVVELGFGGVDGGDPFVGPGAGAGSAEGGCMCRHGWRVLMVGVCLYKYAQVRCTAEGHEGAQRAQIWGWGPTTNGTNYTKRKMHLTRMYRMELLKC